MSGSVYIQGQKYQNLNIQSPTTTKTVENGSLINEKTDQKHHSDYLTIGLVLYCKSIERADVPSSIESSMTTMSFCRSISSFSRSIWLESYKKERKMALRCQTSLWTSNSLMFWFIVNIVWDSDSTVIVSIDVEWQQSIYHEHSQPDGTSTHLWQFHLHVSEDMQEPDHSIP